MHYGEIKACDIANGEGVRVTLFVSGCRNRCPGCFQPETWDFDYGKPFGKATEDEIVSLLRPSYVNGLTLLGGEPMEPENQRPLLLLIERVRRELPHKTIWLYTGFRYEDLLTEGCRGRCEVTDHFLSLVDVLVDGPYVEEEKDISLTFRGSRNQRILDLKATRETGAPVTLGEQF
jgi:anaerobic ribonucleoside-triphosphate reductase activating protein